jgi:hypothetical protein
MRSDVEFESGGRPAGVAGGHFDVYLSPLWDEVVADQTEFLVRHLGPYKRSDD